MFAPQVQVVCVAHAATLSSLGMRFKDSGGFSPLRHNAGCNQKIIQLSARGVI
jgi:hypothetical protein